MNQRKLMPANGISSVAVAIPLRRLVSHSVEPCTPSGILVRIKISTAPNSRANNTPASAAARGVVNRRRLDRDAIVMVSSCHRACAADGLSPSTFDQPQPADTSAQKRADDDLSIDTMTSCGPAAEWIISNPPKSWVRFKLG